MVSLQLVTGQCEREQMIFVGIDWAEDHHDVDVRDEAGGRLAGRRVAHGVEGIAVLHELVATHASDPGEVVVGIETDRGLLVRSLVDAGYQVFAVNPRAVDRYRDRHVLSGAKSDAHDALVLAEMVRTDRHHHRPIAGDSDSVEGLKILTRSHQNLIWARTRHVLQLRVLLLEYYPAMIAATDGHVGTRDALAVLAAAPDPTRGAKLTPARIKRCFAGPAGNGIWTEWRRRCPPGCGQRNSQRLRRSQLLARAAPAPCWR